MDILAVTIPLFLFLLTGYICKQKRVINEDIKGFISKAVYYVAFPAMTIKSILLTDFNSTFKLNLVGHNFIVTCILFVISFLVTYLIKDKKKRGSFNMASFRSNQGYMGLPIILSFFSAQFDTQVGAQAMAKSAIINGFDSLSVIFISVIALEVFSVQAGNGVNAGLSRTKYAIKVARGLLFNFITNPFIIASVLGLVLSYYKVPLLSWDIIKKTLTLAEGTALPLSLLLVGASIDLKAIKNNVKLVAWASFIKLIIAPVAAFLLGWFVFGFRGIDLGICVLLPSMPSAVSAYIMAKEMGTDEELCAATIGFTTFTSVITISIITFILKYAMYQ